MNTASAAGPLTRKEERLLARRFQKTGDQRALNLMVSAHLGLVVKIAQEFRSANIPFDDLVQEGNVGLTIAAHRFDPERSTRLATYAQYWIRAYMMEHVIRCQGPVRIGTTRAQRRIFFGLGKAKRKLLAEGRDIDVDSVAAELDVDVSELEAMTPRLSGHDVYLDDDRRNMNKERSRVVADADSIKIIGESLSRDLPDPEESATMRQEEILQQVQLGRALRLLDPRERDIITSRHLREHPETLAELGRRFGLSRERIRQLESRAKQRMRQLCLDLPTRFARHRRAKP